MGDERTLRDEQIRTAYGDAATRTRAEVADTDEDDVDTDTDDTDADSDDTDADADLDDPS